MVKVDADLGIADMVTELNTIIGVRTTRACKFCQCTERQPCRLLAVKVQFAPDEPELCREYYFLPPGIAIVPHGAQAHIVPCEWLTEDVCTNPACVAEAYLEARALDLTLLFEEAA